MEQIIAKPEHISSLYSEHWSATFASIVSAQRLAKVFDIMQKTVFNVAQKIA